MVDTYYLAGVSRNDADAAPKIKLADNGDGTYTLAVHNLAVGTTVDTTELNPDATNATVISLLRGILQQLQDGIDVNLL